MRGKKYIISRPYMLSKMKYLWYKTSLFPYQSVDKPRQEITYSHVISLNFEQEFICLQLLCEFKTTWK